MKITVSPSTNDERSIAEQLEIITMANREGYLLALVLLAEQYIKNGDGDPASCYYFAQHDLANEAGYSSKKPVAPQMWPPQPKLWSKEGGWQVPTDQDAQDDDEDKIF
jgi:hypothetical protein